MAEEHATCCYEIDGRDTIVSVDDAWLEFARRNGALELDERVVGHSIWEFIAGPPTRKFYEVLFRRVRSQRKDVLLPFRCDSPRAFRFMQLRIAPGEDDRIALQGALLREQARPHCRLVESMIPRSTVELPMCSVCTRVQILGTEWVEVQDAVARLDLFDSVEQPCLDYTVCEDCRALARAR